MANWSNNSGFGGAWGNSGARYNSGSAGNGGGSLGSMGWANTANRWMANAPSQQPSVPNLMDFLGTNGERHARQDNEQRSGPSTLGRFWEQTVNQQQQPSNIPSEPLPGLGGTGWGSGVAGEGRYYDPEATQRGHQIGSLADQLSAGTVSALLEQRNGLSTLADLNNQSRALDERVLRGDYSSDMARLGIRESDLGLDRANNSLRLEGLGIDRRENESDRQYIGRLRDIAARQFSSDSNRISFEGQDQARQIKSKYLTNGTLFAPGHRYDQGANYLRTLNDLENRSLANEEQTAGFDNRELGTRYKDERIGLSEREIGIANQRLDLMAQNLGIDRSTLARNLQVGLERLGLAGKVDAFQLLAQLGDVDSQITGARTDAVNQAAQIISQAAALGMEPGDLYQSAFGFRLPVLPGG